jgi:putative nucleotidyltransferase with HDIG domain
MKLLQDPNVDAYRIECAIRYDPGLTANILKLSNSVYFGFQGKIASIRQAVVRLGWKRLYQLVVATSIHGVMEEPVPGYNLPQGELWRHSIGVAVAAEDLIKELKLPPSEEAFTAALLHDVGKLALGSFVAADFGRIEELAAQGMSFEAAERHILGIDHCEVGGRILQIWAFPSSLVNAALWHHEPDSAQPCRFLSDLVHVADVICLMCGLGLGREGLQYKPSDGALTRLGIKAEHLERVGSRAISEVQEVMNALNPDAAVKMTSGKIGD